MDRSSELMKEQLICKVEANLAKAIKAQRIVNLTTKEWNRLLDILSEDRWRTTYCRFATISRSLLTEVSCAMSLIAMINDHTFAVID